MYLSRLLLAIFVFGAVGTAAELLLLGHFEDVLQFTPLVLIAVALVFATWYGKRPTPSSLRAFQALLVVFVMAGALGVYLHLRGNREFEIERDPSLGGLTLFWEVITGATPALAPGSMVLLAAIGYAATKVIGDGSVGPSSPGT
jgi:hypothetical protein